MRSKISSWVRQSRHRAKKYGVTNDLEVQAINGLVASLNNLCAYCDKPANAMDHPFPLSSGAPNVLANVLPSCQECKATKGSHDLVEFFNMDWITRERLVQLIGEMLKRDGGQLLGDHIKNVTGIGL